METELLAAVCLGRISKMVADFEVPEGPNVQRNRRIYSQDDWLACLAASASLLSNSVQCCLIVSSSSWQYTTPFLLRAFLSHLVLC
jgi:hypothetical protein